MVNEIEKKEVEKVETNINCPRCDSENLEKLGSIYGKQGDKRQKYSCLDCKANGREWTFPEFYKRANDIHKCPQCDSNMIRSGINKGGIHKGEQRFICTKDGCKHIEFEPIEPKEEPKPVEEPKPKEEQSTPTKPRSIVDSMEEYDRKQALKSPEQLQIEEKQHRKAVEKPKQQLEKEEREQQADRQNKLAELKALKELNAIKEKNLVLEEEISELEEGE